MNHSTMEFLKHEEDDDDDDLSIKLEPFHNDQVNYNTLGMIKMEDSDDDSSEENEFGGFPNTLIITGGKKPCDNQDHSERKYFMPKEAIKLMSEIMSDKEDVAEVLKVVTKKYELLSQKFESLKETLLKQEDASHTSSPVVVLPSEEPIGSTFHNLTKESEAISSLPAASNPAVNVIGTGAYDAALVMSPRVTDKTVTPTPNLSMEVAPIFPVDNHLPTNNELYGIWQTPNLFKDIVPQPLSIKPVPGIPFKAHAPQNDLLTDATGIEETNLPTNGCCFSASNVKELMPIPQQTSQDSSPHEKIDEHFHHHVSGCGTDSPHLESKADDFVSRIHFPKEPVVALTDCVNGKKNKAEVVHQSATKAEASVAEGIRKRPKIEGQPKLQDVVDGETFKCFYCGMKYSQKEHLLKHILIHTGETPHECPYCSKKFHLKFNLKRHIFSHTGEKPYGCSYCGKKFSMKSTLKTHILIHTTEQPHGCSICGKKFRLKMNLNRHIFSHKGEKPYECSYCGRKFTLKSTLQHHILVHTGEKPHECSYCSKKFTNKCTLRSHILIHTGEKPHGCSVCGKAFNRKSSLKRHMLTHTEKNPPVFPSSL